MGIWVLFPVCLALAAACGSSLWTGRTGAERLAVGEAEARLLSLGATCPERQPDPDDFLVPTDSVGHSFCLVRRKPWTTD